MEWQPIETAPKDGPVLLYFAAMQFQMIDGMRAHVERTAVGFCDDGDVCEQGTGHSLFEDWRDPEIRPTHWMPLPEPPQTEQDQTANGQNIGQNIRASHA